MQTLTLLLCLVSAAASLREESVAVELRYRGELVSIERDLAGEPVRKFEAYCLLARDAERGNTLSFVVQENGTGGGWPWPEQFGQVSFDAQNQPAGDLRMQLLHELEGLPQPVALSHPLFEFVNKLQPGAKWTLDKSSYEVVGEEKIGQRDCWKVSVSSSLGRLQKVCIDKASGLIVRDERRLTLGQGRPYLLRMQLESNEPADDKRVALLDVPLKTLLTLKKDLKRAENDTNDELTDDQLKQAAGVVERLAREAESTPFALLAAAIASDVKAQQQRSGDVSKLAGKYVGQPAATLNLKTVDGQPISPGGNAQKVIVLHFWPYHGEPLREPYGQVGFLDYLYGRRHKLGVNVFGVAVDRRFGDAATQTAARRDVDKLRRFMNLSYPIAADDGQFLARFGDPQKIGAKLPLWVVIGPDGKIAHYHVGCYDVKADEGLRRLDEVVVDLVKQQHAGSAKDGKDK